MKKKTKLKIMEKYQVKKRKENWRKWKSEEILQRCNPRKEKWKEKKIEV